MKIINIFCLSAFIVCFSCNEKNTADSIELQNKRKVDSLNRIQFLAHCDSADRIYTSIKIPHTWKGAKSAAEVLSMSRAKDSIHLDQRIHIDISTAHQVDIIWSLKHLDLKTFRIISISEQGDSLIFNTIQNISNEPTLWSFKYLNDEKTFASWSIYNPDTKSLLATGKYISEERKDE